LDEALQPNASGNYDGVAVLSALSGQPRAEVLEMLERVKAQSAKTKACLLHQLDPIEGAKLSPTHRCRNCGWEPRAGELALYEQGLAHGRAHATGGGR
jgi:hypothetical protein